MLPRLAGSGTALSRLGGGIGTRGPGETKLETDRRRIRQRIHAISQEIEAIRRRREHSRARRQKASVPLVALVGYTNAGKTTLFNLLTKESAEASDALFVTLDPLVRQVSLPDSRQLLLSDTVGFIDRLPHALVAAFRATLEEVAEADLVLHVIDGASPDRERHVAAVRRVMEEVGAADVAMLDQVGEREDDLDQERREGGDVLARRDVEESAVHVDALALGHPVEQPHRGVGQLDQQLAEWAVGPHQLDLPAGAHQLAHRRLAVRQVPGPAAAALGQHAPAVQVVPLD